MIRHQSASVPVPPSIQTVSVAFNQLSVAVCGMDRDPAVTGDHRLENVTSSKVITKFLKAIQFITIIFIICP